MQYRLRKLFRRIKRLVVRAVYPDELWLQDRHDNRSRRPYRRWSRHTDPGPAFDLIVILSCAVLAIACLLV
ncbi:MAG: hypothetical protein R3C59_09770 [Planctomycetaceae bacterium]